MMPPSAAANAQPAIELHIEELVLHGFQLSRGQGSLVQAAIVAELGRLIAERGLGRSAARDTAELSAGFIQMNGGGQPAHLGRQIAQAVYGGLVESPVAPRTTAVHEGAS